MAEMPNKNKTAMPNTGMPKGRNAERSAHGVGMGQNTEWPECQTVGDFVKISFRVTFAVHYK